MDESEIVVYLQGHEKRCAVWYRVVLGSKEENQAISPVAFLPIDIYGYKGSWVVIDEDDIYWTGGVLRTDDGRNFIVCKYLLKHNIHHHDLTSWDIVTTLNIPRDKPFLVATGRKIAIVAGIDRRIKPVIEFNIDKYQNEEDDDDEEEDDHHGLDHVDDDNNNWRKCGEIYDLDKKTLAYLSSDIENLEPHYHAYQATTDEEAKQVVFYSLVQGSMLIMDASTGRIVKNGDPDPNFALISPQDHPPPGLEDCEDTEPLDIAVGGSTAVFHDRTFYYFTYELRLYGYDVDLQKWFRSECLHHKLYPLKPKPARDYPLFTLLLGLPNGNLLVLVPATRESFTMASLSVNKDDTTSTLHVTVKHTQYFHPADPNFILNTGKAIRLKNSGSGTMQG